MSANDNCSKQGDDFNHYTNPDQINSENISIDISGMPVVIDYLNITLEKDLRIIIPMISRRISGIIYPIILLIFLFCSVHFGIVIDIKVPALKLQNHPYG